MKKYKATPPPPTIWVAWFRYKPDGPWVCDDACETLEQARAAADGVFKLRHRYEQYRLVPRKRVRRGK